MDPTLKINFVFACICLVSHGNSMAFKDSIYGLHIRVIAIDLQPQLCAKLLDVVFSKWLSLFCLRSTAESTCISHQPIQINHYEFG